MPTFIRMASNLRIKADNSNKFEDQSKQDKREMAEKLMSRESSVEKDFE